MTNVTDREIPNIRWIQNGIIVAGENGWGKELNQFARPLCIYVDDDQTVYVSDHFNHRIIEWKMGSINGRIVAGGNGQGNENNRLNGPLKMIIDKKTDSFIICDYYNKRVVRWPRSQNVTSGETIISNVSCSSISMDNDGYVYVVEHEKQQVKRWKIGDIDGTIVAGGNGIGDRLDQLKFPLYIFVDQDHSIYISDRGNNRVMKWIKDAKEGIIVAGGQGQGNSLRQLSNPHGLVVDRLGNVYVADYGNHRVMCWLKGATQGSIVISGNEASQFDYGPCDLSFDRENNLYILDYNNQCVKKFRINSDYVSF